MRVISSLTRGWGYDVDNESNRVSREFFSGSVPSYSFLPGEKSSSPGFFIP